MKKLIFILGFLLMLGSIGALENNSIRIVQTIYQSCFGLALMGLALFATPELFGYVKTEELTRARRERDVYRVQNDRVRNIVKHQISTKRNEWSAFRDVKETLSSFSSHTSTR